MIFYIKHILLFLLLLCLVQEEDEQTEVDQSYDRQSLYLLPCKNTDIVIFESTAENGIDGVWVDGENQ